MSLVYTLRRPARHRPAPAGEWLALYTRATARSRTSRSSCSTGSGPG
ncbi:hypothetical protein HBB16_13465 [Pseudonocardia sp. MCCB 268]|nr:hypothetical protein [Pseudonocardia cytotoxica]